MPNPHEGKTKKKFDNPLNTLSTLETGKAVGSSLVAGQYLRRTFTLTSAQLQKIKAIAKSLRIPETSAARWLIDEGLTQWEKGVRPEWEETETKLEPKLRQW